MNEIHKAYNALGLEPGAVFEIIKRRYRRLALVWHPDRMTNADAKREAEEELKKINNMFEKLKKHFESDHKSGPSCRCQPAAAGPPPNKPQGAGGSGPKTKANSGPTEAEKKRQEDEAARKRTEERRTQAAEAEAAQRAAEAATRAQEKQKTTEEALKSETVRKEEVLRWKCSVGLTFTALIAYCWVGCAARDFVHWSGKQWDDFQSQFKPKEQSAPSYIPQAPSQPTEPYIPPYERFPGGNPTSWQQFHDELQRH